MPEASEPRPAGDPSTGRHVLFGFAGSILGLMVDHDVWGLVSGLCLGLLFASRSSLLKQVERQQAWLADLERRLVEGPASPSDSETSHTAQTVAVDVLDASGPFDSIADSTASAEVSAPPDEPVPSVAAPPSHATGSIESSPASAPASRPPASPPRPRGPNFTDQAVTAIRSFLFGGNTVVRVGLLVLLVGLTLLAKYAADNDLFPIEARLASVALAGLGLVGFGFRQRIERPGFGLSLQGGGIAALYLVTFFALKPYALLPASLAFSIFVALAASTAVLSVLQNSEPLIVIGTLGGFLAPVLASTGSGSHVALFSYYTLLITSVALVAWRQSWRWPGLISFYLTYGVATVWGVDRYQPELYSTTQPFVLIGLVLFTSIAILHAWARPPQLRGFIDGTLVFGTPILSIGIQRYLVMDFELGLALSAAGFALFYLACALLVRRAGPDEARPLVESFIALAVGFATMAIPFAFDEALTTSIAWALEGAGLYWVGTRQSRFFPRLAGLALQLMAGAAFFTSVALEQIKPAEFLPIANGRAISCIALTLAGLFIARTAYRARSRQHPLETTFAQILGAWALLWWAGGTIAEVDQFVSVDWIVAALVTATAATAFALEMGAARFDWKIGRLYALVSLPASGLLFLGSFEAVPHLLTFGGWLAWPILFTCFYFLWARGEWADAESADRSIFDAFRIGALWFGGLFVPCALSGLIGVGFGLENDWQVAGFGAALAATLFAGVSRSQREQAPFDRHPHSAIGLGLGPIAGFAAFTILGMQFAGNGDASPLPHLPILNPLDVAVWLLVLSLWTFWRRVQVVFIPDLNRAQRTLLSSGVVALAFAVLNGLLARAVHQWAGVDYDADALWNSSVMHVVISIAWTSVGLVGMLLSSRRHWRQPWMVCAALLGVVVVKLFTVDLGQLSTVARIGTFLVVGIMLLILGYFSPVPPSGEAPDDSTTGAEPEPTSPDTTLDPVIGESS